MGLAQVEGVDGVDAAEDENILAPVDDLVAQLELGRVVADLEILRHPQVEQRDVLRHRLLGLIVERGANGVGRCEVGRPCHPAERRPVAALTESQFVRPLEHGGNDVAFLVVQVAVVNVGVVEVRIRRGALPCTVDQLPETTCRRCRTAILPADHALVRRLHATLDAERDCRIQRAADAVVEIELEGVRLPGPPPCRGWQRRRPGCCA